MTEAAAKAGMFRRITSGTLNYGLGSTLPQVISFLLIPVFTAYLSPADYGTIDLAATLTAMLVLAMRLGLPGAVTRFYFEHKEGAELTHYVTTIATFVLISTLVVAGLTLAVMPFVGQWVTPGLDYLPFVVLAVLSAMFAGNSDLQRRLIQAREQSSYSLRLNLFTALLTTALALVLVVGLRLGAMGMMLAEVLGVVALFAQAVHYLGPNLKGRFEWPMLKSSLGYAAGILPSHLIGTVAPLATRSMLVHFDSLTALGLFALASRFTRPVSILITAFNSAFLPIYFAERKLATEEAHARLARAASGVWLLAVFTTLVMALLAPAAILILTPERFHAAAPLVPYLVLGALATILNVILGAEIYFQRATHFIPVLAVVGTGSMLISAMALVPTLGARGLALSSALGMWVNGLGATWYTRRMVKLPYPWASMVRVGVMALLVGIAASLLPMASPWLEALKGAAACALFAAALWVLKDAVFLEALALAKRKLK